MSNSNLRFGKKIFYSVIIRSILKICGGSKANLTTSLYIFIPISVGSGETSVNAALLEVVNIYFDLCHVWVILIEP